MKIFNVSLTVRDLGQAVRFYRDVLQFPVEVTSSGAEVTVGFSRLSLASWDSFEGAHHVAFGILPQEFELAHKWLARRVELLTAEGTEIILGSDEWKSRSLYFFGPEGIVLEFIARDADTTESDLAVDSPRMLSISEVGFGVADVLDTVRALSEELAIPHFYDCSSSFASMGGHDGLLIVVQQDRVWFPTASSRPAQGSLHIELGSEAQQSRLHVSSTITIGA